MLDRLTTTFAMARIGWLAGSPQFREVAALAAREVGRAQVSGADGPVKHATAYTGLKAATAARGLDTPDWWINLAIEMAVAALKAGVGRLFGAIPPTIRLMVGVLLLAGTANAAPFRFYATVDGSARNIPAKSTDAPLDVAVDVTPFPIGKQVPVSAFTVDTEARFLLAIRASGVTGDVTIRWAQRQASAGTVTTTVPTTTRPSTTQPGQPTTTRPPGPVPTTTLPPPGEAPTPARFPTGRDISIRIPHDQRCRWWSDVPGGPLRTATQAERAALFLEEAAVIQPEAMRYATHTAGCQGVAARRAGEYETDQLRLRSFYVDPDRDSEWSILGRNSCHPYGHVERLLRDIQACATASDRAAQACAQSFLMGGELLAAADLRIVNGRCTKGADFPTPVYPEKEDPALQLRGRLVYNQPLPTLTRTQRGLACAVLTLHEAGSRAKCGLPSTPAETAALVQARCGVTVPAGQTTRAAELALLRSAVTEKQKHAFLMLFTGSMDTTTTGWTPQDQCDLGMLEHFAWAAWDAALDLPPAEMWGILTRARVTHETTHLWAAWRTPTVRWRLGDHQHRLMDVAPRTQAQWLACLRDGSCRPAWLPADWRILITPDTSHH